MASYPDSWSSLHFPNVRWELLEYLKDATDPKMLEDRHELKFLVHFIFDDHDFGPDANAMIGYALLDSEEAGLLNVFVRSLDTMIGPAGKPYPASFPNVPEVCAKAEAALHLLVSRGIPK
jgi:hypothetical protein